MFLITHEGGKKNFCLEELHYFLSKALWGGWQGALEVPPARTPSPCVCSRRVPAHESTQPLIRVLPDLIKLFILACLQIFLSTTSFKVDLKFSGTSAPIRAFPQVPPPSTCFDSQSERKRIFVFWKSMSLLLTCGRCVELVFHHKQKTHLLAIVDSLLLRTIFFFMK